MGATRTRVIGSTRLIEPLGQGGMAEVWRALQGPLQREVAVKVMLPEVAADPDAVTRFRREALALAALHHENIVAIHDLVEKNGQLFMVMELVDGVDVASLLEAGPLPLEVSLLIGIGVAAALEHAHFRKVIHRDIKPANVLISRTGEVKLSDFGIAKDLTIDDLTKTGLVVGTPAYLAPEQVAGKRADPRTDIYALGVLLFQCLTGKKPVTGKSQGELLINISRGERRRLRRLSPQTPRYVEKIVDRCLAVRPDKRWPRAVDLRRELERRAAALLMGTPSARLVKFLRDRGEVRADELSALDLEEQWFVDGTSGTPRRRLTTTGAVAAPSSDAISIDLDLDEVEVAPRRSRRGWAFAAFGAVAAVAAGWWWIAPDHAASVLTSALDWLRSLGSG